MNEFDVKRLSRMNKKKELHIVGLIWYLKVIDGMETYFGFQLVTV